MQDVADEDVEGHLTTVKCDAPCIVCFTQAGELTGTFIVGDNQVIKVDSLADILAAITELMATYYTFNLTYPRPYAVTLGLFQMFVMGDPFKQQTSQGFKLLVKEVRDAWSSVEQNI